MSDLPDQPKKSAGDVAHTIVKAAVSAAPVVGGPAAELLGLIFGPPLERRREAWLNLLAEAVKEDQSKAAELTPEKLSQDAGFISTGLRATEIAIRTHEQEKLEAPRNAVVNSVLPNSPEDTIEQIFLNYVDALTPWHLKLLAYFDDPTTWANSHGMTFPNPNWYSGSPAQALETAMPGLAGRRAFYDVIISGLEQRGLLGGGGIHGMVTAVGMLAQRTTPLGRQFLSFISKHPLE